VLYRTAGGPLIAIIVLQWCVDHDLNPVKDGPPGDI
jgi:hypothetical protein